jgi:hypothetical protein
VPRCCAGRTFIVIVYTLAMMQRGPLRSANSLATRTQPDLAERVAALHQVAALLQWGGVARFLS